MCTPLDPLHCNSVVAILLFSVFLFIPVTFFSRYFCNDVPRPASFARVPAQRQEEYSNNRKQQPRQQQNQHQQQRRQQQRHNNNNIDDDNNNKRKRRSYAVPHRGSQFPRPKELGLP